MRIIPAAGLARRKLAWIVAGTALATATAAHAAAFFFNSGTTSGWDYIFTAGKPYNITSSNLRSRLSGYSIRAEVKGGETDFAGRYHSEVIKHGAGRRGLTRWYGESFLIPDYSFDGQYTINQFFNREITKKPNVLLQVRPDNKLNIKILWVDSTDPCPVNGCADITMNYTFQRNTWYDLVWNANWQSDSTGFLRIWIRPANGTWTKILDRTGPNTYPNDSDIEFHAGAYAYRDVDLSVGEQRFSYLDEFRFGDSNSSLTEVAPQ